MPRRFIRKDTWEYGCRPDPESESEVPKSRKRRLATSFVFTTLFFAGASLAAVAGNQLSIYGESDGAIPADSSTTTTDAAPDPAAPAPDAPTEPAAPESSPAPDASAPAADAPEAAPADLSSPSLNDGVAPSRVAPAAGDPASAAPAANATGAPMRAQKARVQRAHLRHVLLPKVKPAPAPEIEGPISGATVWLNSPLPDPTPPAVRLSSKFAKNLRSAAKGSGVDWAVMLGILRARGAAGHAPADSMTLHKLAGRLSANGPAKGDWAMIVSYSGDTRFADKAAALARYNRAVGLEALVSGLEAAKPSIATRLLADPTVSIYEAGRNDIIQDKVDVRVLALVAYLHESFGQVTVSSLISGHRLYARPGVISAHIAGRAVDISGLDGMPIQGHQAPGGLTERAVRDILMLPDEVMPRQVISLLGMGGASFPMADHYNHIHIGY
jgi:hypothetical protein